jgi:hypothetical protein
MADFSGEQIQWIILAGESSRFSRQDILAGHFGAFIWQVFTLMNQANSRKEKKSVNL